MQANGPSSFNPKTPTKDFSSTFKRASNPRNSSATPKNSAGGHFGPNRPSPIKTPNLDQGRHQSNNLQTLGDNCSPLIGSATIKREPASPI